MPNSNPVFKACLFSLALFGSLIVTAPASAQVDLPARRLPGKPPLDYKFRDSDGEIVIDWGKVTVCGTSPGRMGSVTRTWNSPATAPSSVSLPCIVVSSNDPSA